LDLQIFDEGSGVPTAAFIRFPSSRPLEPGCPFFPAALSASDTSWIEPPPPP